MQPKLNPINNLGLKLKHVALLIMFYSLICSLEVDGTPVTMIYLKTCRGWCLKKYPIIKEFLEQDFDHYDPKIVEVDYLGGGFPRLVLVDENKENLKTYDISKLTREKVRNVFKALEIKLVKPLRPLHDVDELKVNKLGVYLLMCRRRTARERPRLKKQRHKVRFQLQMRTYKWMF